jgi:UDP-N-acetylglucosamine--N-acetylmuramyl-(pentapeptide) pyrophosphoryl-undecaprenol N-acetylglucosamine transferase
MNAVNPLVLIMAGGTGGHIFPALAVANELQERGFRVEWIGTAMGLEARVVPAAGIPLHCLAVRGVRGKNPLRKVVALMSLMVAAVQALWLVLRLSPSCVVGLGGYVAGPAGVAAWLLRKPLIIQEQNAVAGTSNRMLAPLATKVFTGFSGAFTGDVETETVGNPVRAELIRESSKSSYDYDGVRALRLLIIGGSQGAKPINDVIPATLSDLRSRGLAEDILVRHQCGELHDEAVTKAYGEEYNAQVVVSAFIEDMAEAYSWADIVLCRAGALTVSELAIMGRPSILIPLPQAIDDHQTYNARTLEKAGAALLLKQSDMTSVALADALQSFIQEPKQLMSMSHAAAAAAKPDATRLVCDFCEAIINGR